jgi:hypothetical protein
LRSYIVEHVCRLGSSRTLNLVIVACSVRLKWAALTFGLVAVGCSEPAASPPRQLPSGNAQLQIDDVTLFVPIAWNALRPWHPRPWPNGLGIGSGGWGRFTPRGGPLELAEPSKTYVTKSEGQQTRPDRPDPFFFLTVTFEFPAPSMPSRWWGRRRPKTFFPFSFDQLTLSYETAAREVERERPYTQVLGGLGPGDGEDVGYGWRQVRRPLANREVLLRFDASDWRARGGPLPRRMAASFGPPFWSHFATLDRTRWTAAFETQNLPLEQWRARYVTAGELFAWLQTSPERRDPSRRFEWWSDLRSRPTR